MVGLLADVWFYISSFGLLVSGVLFFFLLSQYRAAAAATDRGEGGDGAPTIISEEPAAGETAPVQFVYAMPDAPVTKTTVASIAEPRPPEATLILDPKEKTLVIPPTAKAPPPAPPPPPEPKTPPFEKRASAAGIAAAAHPAPSEDVPQASASPAAAYLQGLKSQLDSLQQEVRGLSQRLDAANQRDEAMIARLGEIAKIVSGLNQASGSSGVAQLSNEREAPRELTYDFGETMHRGIADMIDAHFADRATEAPAPAPAEPAAAEPAPAAHEASATTAPVEPAPAAATVATEPVTAPVEAPAAAAASSDPAAEPERRRGPVWPV